MEFKLDNLQPQFHDHFKSQLLYLEVIGENVKIIFDGGGFETRHKLMLDLIKRSFSDFPSNRTLRFFIFTGDNRPIETVNNEPLFSIAGPRIKQDFIIPDPHSLAWPEANVLEFNSYCEKIFQYSLKNKNLIPNLIWRGSKFVNKFRENIITQNEQLNIPFFNFKHVDKSNKEDFIEMYDLSKYAILLDLPGGGFSSRIKYLLHTCRPIIITDGRINWDYGTINLEPGIHYVYSSNSIEDLTLNTKKILENYKFYINQSVQTYNLIKDIMQRKNISYNMVNKIQRYV